MVKHSFPPVVDPATTRLLICGSLPGDRSLAEGRYYANPRNQFWHLMSPVAGADLPALEYADRLKALLAAGIGLWDVVAAADRAGSGDAAIRRHRLNDLPALVAGLPALRAVAFNGARAYTLGARALSGTRLLLVRLPSSSAANACGLTIKRAAYCALAAHLHRDA